MKNTAVGANVPTLGVVGAGRAGTALSLAAVRAGYRVVAVSSRDPADAAGLAALFGADVARDALAVVRAAELTLLTVPDSAVVGLAAAIAASGVALRGHAVVHCSASFGPDSLAALRQAGADVGVLHPLQALAGPGSAALLRGSYFRIEAAGGLESDLLDLVAALGGHRIVVSKAGRALYHAAAVLTASGPLALLDRAAALFEEAGVDRHTAKAALAALLHGAATNAMENGAASALTGPVARGDSRTIAVHLRALAHDPDVRELYLMLALETARLAGRDPDELGLAPEPQERLDLAQDAPPMPRVA